ncbi:unnamed protein product [Paramecium octaurelia]|uniref:Uncharacterized protein n=1 Tax=Paramecium octaurelia TaxID=43137 RepID=A0A8S1W723_PAROT|nr:unnamed protein product [Paramecium octaurelia]
MIQSHMIKFIFGRFLPIVYDIIRNYTPIIRWFLKTNLLQNLLQKHVFVSKRKGNNKILHFLNLPYIIPIKREGNLLSSTQFGNFKKESTKKFNSQNPFEKKHLEIGAIMIIAKIYHFKL